MSQFDLRQSILDICGDAARTLGERHTPFHQALQQVYLDVLKSGIARKTAQEADRLFSAVMDLGPQDSAAIRRFINGWGDMHVSADSVGILALKLGRIGMEQSSLPALQAQHHMLEIIAEDLGEGGKPHRDMFAHFANTLCMPGSWRDDAGRHNKTRACVDFRAYNAAARTTGDVVDASLIVAASELWNVGEYTALTAPMRNWMMNGMGVTPGCAVSANAYIQVHGGDTELRHFHHAIEAARLMSEDTVNPAGLAEQAGIGMKEYLTQLGKAYEGLADKVEAVRNDASLLRRQAAAAGAAYI